MAMRVSRDKSGMSLKELRGFLDRRVRWESRGGGARTIRTGKVLAVLKAGDSALKKLPRGESRSRFKNQEVSQFNRLLIQAPEKTTASKPPITPPTRRSFFLKSLIRSSR